MQGRIAKFRNQVFGGMSLIGAVICYLFAFQNMVTDHAETGRFDDLAGLVALFAGFILLTFSIASFVRK